MQLSVVATQQCNKCGETKPIVEFDVRADTGRPAMQCRACRRRYQNERCARLHQRKPKPVRLAGTTDLLLCTRCGETKSASAFPPIRRGQPRLQAWCRACFSVVSAKHYAENATRERERIVRSRLARENETRRRLLEAEYACAGCGQRDGALLAFERSPERMRTTAGLVHSGWSWGRVAAFINGSVINCRRCRGRQRRAPQRPARPRFRTPSRPTLNDKLEGRTCPRCGEFRPLEDFAPKYRELPRPASYCRDCQRAYHRQWYQRNRYEVIARVRANRTQTEDRQEKKIVYLAARRQRWHYLLAHPCVDCGEGDPIVLEFDHRSGKRAGINELMRRSTDWTEINTEIEKCDVRCANCHRWRTASSRGYYRDLLDPVGKRHGSRRTETAVGIPIGPPLRRLRREGSDRARLRPSVG